MTPNDFKVIAKMAIYFDDDLPSMTQTWCESMLLDQYFECKNMVERLSVAPFLNKDYIEMFNEDVNACFELLDLLGVWND